MLYSYCNKTISSSIWSITYSFLEITKHFFLYVVILLFLIKEILGFYLFFIYNSIVESEGSFNPKLFWNFLWVTIIYLEIVSTYCVFFWWLFFIIKLRHQLVFGINEGQTPNLLFDNKRLYQLSNLKPTGDHN